MVSKNAMQSLEVMAKDFLHNPEAFGYDSFVEVLLDLIGEKFTNEELKLLAQRILSK